MKFHSVIRDAWVVAFVAGSVGLGCAASEPIDLGPQGAAGAEQDGGGAAGTAGEAGRGGTTGAAGRGGTTGVAGTTGVGRGGTTGAAGRGGTTGTAGRGGTTGAAGRGGTTGTNPDAGTATFTQVYNSLIAVSCAGADCHNPGTQNGVSFRDRNTAYSYIRNQVIPGNPQSSYIYFIIAVANPRFMPPLTEAAPPDGPVAQLAAWINAGAMNN